MVVPSAGSNRKEDAMKIMPYIISDNYGTHLENTGHTLVWKCSVSGCGHHGSGNELSRVEIMAARHSVGHTDTEISSTGYVVRVNWADLAAERLAA
jgi:hypothetical protein